MFCFKNKKESNIQSLREQRKVKVNKINRILSENKENIKKQALYHVGEKVMLKNQKKIYFKEMRYGSWAYHPFQEWERDGILVAKVKSINLDYLFLEEVVSRSHMKKDAEFHRYDLAFIDSLDFNTMSDQSIIKELFDQNYISFEYYLVYEKENNYSQWGINESYLSKYNHELAKEYRKIRKRKERLERQLAETNKEYETLSTELGRELKFFT